MLCFSARAHKSQPGHYLSSCNLLLLLCLFTVCGRSILNLLSICPQLFVLALGGHIVSLQRLCSNTPPKHTRSQGGFPCWPSVSGLYYKGDGSNLQLWKQPGHYGLAKPQIHPCGSSIFSAQVIRKLMKSFCCCFQNAFIIEFFFLFVFFFISPISISCRSNMFTNPEMNW